VVLLAVAIGIGATVGRMVIGVGRRAVRRTKSTFDDRLVTRAAAPLYALFAVLVFRGLVEFAGLSIGAKGVVGLLVRVASVGFFTWLLVRTTYVLEEELPALPVTGHEAQLRSFAPLIGRVARIFMFSIGAIAIVAQFGYPVTTLLTGLGIGGIALAFAAQKTLEHPFGSIAIGLDQPIRVGDWVRVGDAQGEVEAIGLRSTRIRTMERTLVVFPNGRLAEMQMENFGVRDRIMFQTDLRLQSTTPVDRLRHVRQSVNDMLAEHPLIWPDRVIVRFKGFGSSSLDIEIVAWVATTDYNIFREAREEILFKIMDIIAASGTALVFGTQTTLIPPPRADDPNPGGAGSIP
jgi:MscS family membrane protein